MRKFIAAVVDTIRHRPLCAADSTGRLVAVERLVMAESASSLDRKWESLVNLGDSERAKSAIARGCVKTPQRHVCQDQHESARQQAMHGR